MPNKSILPNQHPDHSSDYSGPLPPLDVVNYDNMPVGDFGTHPSTAQHRWAIPIGQVDQERRDQRVLDSPVEAYLEIIGKHPRLPEHRERQMLVEFAKTHDTQLGQTILLHSLGIVVDIVKKYRRSKEIDSREMADMLQVGTLGLMKAIDTYNPDYISEITHKPVGLYTWAKRLVIRALDVQYRPEVIALPHSHRIKLAKISWARRIFMEEHAGAEPSTDELAKLTGIDSEELAELKVLSRQPLSLDQIIGRDDEAGVEADGEWLTRANLPRSGEIPTEDEVIECVGYSGLRKAMGELSDKERLVIALRFGFGVTPLSLDETGRLFNVTRERIRQIEIQAIKKLGGLTKIRYLGDMPMPTPEEERDNEVRRNWRSNTSLLHPAWQARLRTHEIQSNRERQELNDRIDHDFEELVISRAFGDNFQASTKLPTRQNYYGQFNEVAPYILSEIDDSNLTIQQYRQTYGHFAAAVADLVLQSMHELHGMGKKMTLAEIEGHVAEVDDSMYGVNPKFIKVILDTFIEAGMVTYSRPQIGAGSDQALAPGPREYYLTYGEPSALEQQTNNPYVTLPDKPYMVPTKQVMNALCVLGIDNYSGKGVSFEELTRHAVSIGDVKASAKFPEYEYVLRNAIIALVAQGLIVEVGGSGEYHLRDASYKT